MVSKVSEKTVPESGNAPPMLVVPYKTPLGKRTRPPHGFAPSRQLLLWQKLYKTCSFQGVVANCELQLANPSAPGKSLKRSPQQPRIRDHFRDNINQRPNPTQKQNNK